MLKKYLQTDYLFLITGILVILVFILLFPNLSFFVDYKNTFIIIGHTTVLISLCIFFLIPTLIYFFFKRVGKSLSRPLTLFHYFLTIISILIFAILRLRYQYIVNHNPIGAVDSVSKIDKKMIIPLLIIAFAQFIFLLNIIVGIIKLRINHKKSL